MKKMMAAALLASLVGACNSEPDPGFQNALDARASADAGDPYQDLDNGDRRWGLQNYTNRKAAQQQPYAQTLTINMQSRYAGLFAKLDDDETVDRNAPLFKTCRAEFQHVSDFAAAAGLTKDQATVQAKALYASLEACRTKLQQGGIKGAPTLRRFSSYGMALAGVALVAKGEIPTGSQLWSKGARAAEEDMPGFQIQLNNFR